MAFKERFVNLINIPLRKDVVQLSSGAQAPFQFVFDSFVLLSPIEAFVDVDPQGFCFVNPFDNFIIEDKVWQIINYFV